MDLIPVKGMEVMKVGSHTANDGKVVNITAADLTAIAANFSAAGYAPPVVVGHPKLDDPRYGDITNVYVKGDKLFADAGLIPEFHALAKKGMYPDRSLRLGKAANGKGWTVRHLGFLGAAAPSVKGLAPVQFSEGEEGLTLDFSGSWEIVTVGGIFQRMRDFFIEKFGLESADNIIKQWEIDDLKRTPVMEDTQASPAFSEPTTQGGSTMTKEEEEALRKRVADLEAEKVDFAASEGAKDQELIDLRKKDRERDFAAFVGSLPEQIIPAMKSDVLDFMEILSAAEEFDFSEQDGDAVKKVKVAPVERFKAFLKGLPKQVDFNEFATKGKGITLSESEQVVAGIASASPKEQ